MGSKTNAPLSLEWVLRRLQKLAESGTPRERRRALAMLKKARAAGNVLADGPTIEELEAGLADAAATKGGRSCR